jgi:hypothetical protein
MTVQVDVKLPLDVDGFLRRECPNCEREFKWHHGKTDAAPEGFIYPDVYWCPLCGKSATHGSWWTPEQLAFARESAAGPILDELTDELRSSFTSSRNSFIKFELKQNDRPDPPDPLVESDDMVMIAPPCQPWEPVKVPEDASEPFYCLVCGESYAV